MLHFLRLRETPGKRHCYCYFFEKCLRLLDTNMKQEYNHTVSDWEGGVVYEEGVCSARSGVCVLLC